MLKALGKGTKFTVLAVWLIFTVFPLYWMALTSIRPVREVTQKIYFPKSNSTLDSYRTLFSQYAFGTYLRNSLLVALAAAAFGFLVWPISAYSLSSF